MTIDELRAIAAKAGGEDKILAIQFNGTAGYVIFSPSYRLNLTQMYHPQSDSLILEKTTMTGSPMTIYKPLDSIYSVVTIPDINMAENYDPRFLFG